MHGALGMGGVVMHFGNRHCRPATGDLHGKGVKKASKSALMARPRMKAGCVLLRKAAKGNCMYSIENRARCADNVEM
jgi:hypothetical protein